MDQYPPNGCISRLPRGTRPLVGGGAATTLSRLGTLMMMMIAIVRKNYVRMTPSLSILFQAFSSLVNRSRVVFQLPSSGSSGDEEEDGSAHPSSAVARTTTTGGVVSDSSEKRPCEDRKKANCAATNRKLVNLVAIEFLLDQQRSFLPSSRLQPFQVYTL